MAEILYRKGKRRIIRVWNVLFLAIIQKMLNNEIAMFKEKSWGENYEIYRI